MKTARRVRKGACGKRPVATPAPRPQAYLARPTHIWGTDFFGIEGYDRDESITVRTLRQRKRRLKKRAKLCQS
jgi:hypothetical protein